MFNSEDGLKQADSKEEVLHSSFGMEQRSPWLGGQNAVPLVAENDIYCPALSFVSRDKPSEAPYFGYKNYIAKP